VKQRFGGLERLYGRGSLERLATSTVTVVGIGGVGSWTVEALARSGVGRIRMVDLDDVCVTNVNRQLHAVEGAVGRPKVVVMAERVRLIHPECDVQPVSAFFTAKTPDAVFDGCGEVVVDAIDKMSNKAALIAESRQRGVGMVTVGGAGGKRDGTMVRAGDLAESIGDELLRMVRRKLRRDHGFEGGEGNIYGIRCIYSAEKPVYPWADGSVCAEKESGSDQTLDCATGFGTAAHVTGAFGLAAAGEVLGLLLGKA